MIMPVIELIILYIFFLHFIFYFLFPRFPDLFNLFKMFFFIFCGFPSEKQLYFTQPFSISQCNQASNCRQEKYNTKCKVNKKQVFRHCCNSSYFHGKLRKK